MQSIGGGDWPQAPSLSSLTYPTSLALSRPLSSPFKEKGEDIKFTELSHKPHSTYCHPDRAHSRRKNSHDMV